MTYRLKSVVVVVFLAAVLGAVPGVGFFASGHAGEPAREAKGEPASITLAEPVSQMR